MAGNGDAVRDVYAAFAKGDVNTVLGAMSDKIDWREPVSLPFEDQIGPGAVAENVFATLPTLLDSFSVNPSEIIDAGDVVTAIGVYRGTGLATGKTLEADFAHVWRFDGDGKVSGFRTYTDTHQWLEVLGTA